MSETSLQPPQVLKLHETDNVAVAVRLLRAGEQVRIDDKTIVVKADLPVGHKLAICAIGAGEKIIKWGCPIGAATSAIQPGEHVHTHNVKSLYIPTFSWGEAHAKPDGGHA